MLAALLILALAEATPASVAATIPQPKVTPLDVHSFRVVEKQSGPVDYYKVIEDPEGAFIRASYQPPMETTVLAIEVPERLRQGVKRVHWRWRARTFPLHGNECKDGFGDSAAVVYVTWKRGLRWYTLKYVWSPEAERGAVCDQRRNPFVAHDTLVMESGGPTGVWKTVEIDPSFEFRVYFEDGDPKAEVPPLVGIGIMTDGDQTHSNSSADYADFKLIE